MTPLRCEACGTTAPPHFVACPVCRALFHAGTLVRLEAEARAHEARGETALALARLREMGPLLPEASTQVAEVRARIATLEAALGKSPGTAGVPKWLLGFGAAGALAWKVLAPLLALASKGKLLLAGLLKAPTLASMALSASVWGGGGVGVALVMVTAIYVHEMGHVWAFRRYGIEVTAPMFVPGFGAFVRGTHYPQAAWPRADVALSGPLWGGVAGLVTLAAAVVTGQPWLALSAVLVAEMNLFNLVPVWQLDGNRALGALSRRQVGVLGAVGLVGAALVGSPLGAAAALGHLVRTVAGPPAGSGDRRAFWTFLGVVLGLLLIRGVAPWLAAPDAAAGK